MDCFFMNNFTPVKTILILAANPASTSKLRLDEEVREIEEGLLRANKGEQFKLEQKWARRPRDFYQAILDYKPQIIHFSGYGAGNEGIVLEDETGQPAQVKTDVLASQFELFATKGVECVVLNACYRDEQAQAIRQYVNYVIGMNSTVGDKAAVAFAVAFYDAIAAGEEVEFAYKLGCSHMINFVAHETPVFLKKEHPYVSPVNTNIIPPNPYQGLTAFKEEDAEFFFGRETFVNSLVEAARKQPLVGVIGSSGSGKSSVIYAGLIPHLRKEGSWLIESFRPGNQPFYQLATALVRQLEPELGETGQLREASGLAGDLQIGKVTLEQVVSRIAQRNPSKRLLLVADQFEELYTLCQDKAQQECFAEKSLAAIATKSFTLVFTLRADFYGYVISYRPWRDALQKFSPQLLSAMNREELQRAIEQPAQKLEVQLEPQLTQLILNDVGSEPGNLPLLEFALTRLWEKQQNRVLTHIAYEEIGGVKKALANHAEQIYQQLSETEQKAAQRIFVQLVRPGEGTEDTRRVATRKEVGDQNWPLVSYLAGHTARLVVTGRDDKSREDTVEVVHEALIREWSTLKEWMNANREFRVWQERLKVAMHEWKNNNSDSGALLRGGSLTVAEEWLHKRSDEMTTLEKLFIDASVKQRDRDHQAEEERQRQKLEAAEKLAQEEKARRKAEEQARQQAEQRAEEQAKARQIAQQLAQESEARRKAEEQARQQAEQRAKETKIRLMINRIASVILGGLVIFAGFMWRKALMDEITALSSTAEARLSSNHEFDDLDALIKSLQTGRKLQQLNIVVNPKVRNQAIGKLQKVVSGVKERNRFNGHDGVVRSVSFSPNGQLVASGGYDGTVRLWDLKGKEVALVVGNQKRVTSVSFSPNGSKLAATGTDGFIYLWDVQGNQLTKLTKFAGKQGGISTVTFSLDGSKLVTAGDGSVHFWDLKGNLLSKFAAHNQGNEVWVTSVSFSPDGSKLATTGFDGTARLWDLKNNNQQFPEIEKHQGDVWSIRFSPNGQLVASAGKDGTVKVWNLQSQQKSELKGHQGTVRSLSFNSDGKQLVTVGDDSSVRVWNVQTGKQIEEFKGHQGIIQSVSFSRDGKQLVTGGNDSTVRLWDLKGQKQVYEFNGDTGIWSSSFSPDGDWLAIAGDQGTARLWSPKNKRQFELKGHKGVVWSISFSRNGKLVATASEDKTARLWNLNGESMAVLEGHQDEVQSVSFSPTEDKLATSSNDGTVRLWDYQGNLLKDFIAHKDHHVMSVNFSPDGKLLATAGRYDTTVRLWNLEGNEIAEFQGHTKPVLRVKFSPDGKRLASVGDDGIVLLWDVESKSAKPVKQFQAHQVAIKSISFSPDGKLLATSSSDRTAIVWDLDTQAAVATFTGHQDWVESVNFSPDGQSLVTASKDNTAKIWRLETLDNLMTQGCDWVRNYFKNNSTQSENREICNGITTSGS